MHAEATPYSRAPSYSRAKPYLFSGPALFPGPPYSQARTGPRPRPMCGFRVLVVDRREARGRLRGPSTSGWHGPSLSQEIRWVREYGVAREQCGSPRIGGGPPINLSMYINIYRERQRKEKEGLYLCVCKSPLREATPFPRPLCRQATALPPIGPKLIHSY